MDKVYSPFSWDLCHGQLHQLIVNDSVLMPESSLSILKICSCLVFMTPLWGKYCYSPQVKKLRHGEVKKHGTWAEPGFQPR